MELLMSLTVSYSCWLSLDVPLASWSCYMSLTISHFFWLPLTLSSFTLKLLHVSHNLLLLLALNVSPYATCLSLSPMIACSLFISLMSLYVSHCLSLMLAVSHSLSGPIALFHVSNSL